MQRPVAKTDVWRLAWLCAFLICAAVRAAETPAAPGPAAPEGGRTYADVEKARLQEQVQRLEARVKALNEQITALETKIRAGKPDISGAAAQKLDDVIKRLARFGEDYYLRGDYKGAWPLLKSAVDFGSTDPEVLFELGYCYSSIMEWEQAAENYAKAAAGFAADKKTESRRLDALNNLAVVQMMARQWDKAIATLQETIRIEPAYAPAWFNLGVIQEEHLKEPAKAIESFRRHIVLGGGQRHSAEAAIERIQKAQEAAKGPKPETKPDAQ